jgi:histone H3/H4
MEFSTRSMHQLIQTHTGKRVSENAADKLGRTLEQFASEIAEEAQKLAEEDGYQTVKQEHVKEILSNHKERRVEVEGYRK